MMEAGVSVLEFGDLTIPQIELALGIEKSRKRTKKISYAEYQMLRALKGKSN